ncbi:hypothetical protein [Entomobacter blattae]|uniref:Uncharacterized protein n=1 Tax=Entomobacter blattae TaxID=2762277 RepID=A0A7H1NUG3_9PROT|nr:hypothetical protein [Entomobacter blattae]QNT79423.1 hypothetical protein JGUZn3_22220 [Entomobacter blattae]
MTNDVLTEQDRLANHAVWKRTFHYYRRLAFQRKELPGKRLWAKTRMKFCQEMMERFKAPVEQL